MILEKLQLRLLEVAPTAVSNIIFNYCYILLNSIEIRNKILFYLNSKPEKEFQIFLKN